MTYKGVKQHVFDALDLGGLGTGEGRWGDRGERRLRGNWREILVVSYTVYWFSKHEGNQHTCSAAVCPAGDA